MVVPTLTGEGTGLPWACLFVVWVAFLAAASFCVTPSCCRQDCAVPRVFLPPPCRPRYTGDEAHESRLRAAAAAWVTSVFLVLLVFISLSP